MIDRLFRSPLVYLLIFAFYVVGLWGMSVPLTGDQKVYLSIALEMKERGEWIIPYLFGEANFLKPPLQYWATLLGWKIFGLSLFGALIPSVLALMGSAVLVNRIAKLEFGSRTFLPGLIFSSCLGTMTYGTTAQMEIWIVLFYVWAWFELLQNRIFRALLVVGVMAWIKGPLYPALWVLSSWLYFVLKDESKKIVSKPYLVSLGVGILVGLTWYVLAARTHLQAMLDVFLLRENVAKMQTSQGTPWGLWGEFLYSLFPWVFWLILTLSSKSSRDRLQKHRAFLISYAVLPAIFFTFFPYRVNTYLYLLTPIAVWLLNEDEPVTKSLLSRVLSAWVWVLALALSLLCIRLSLGNWIGFEVGFPLILALGLWAVFFTKLNLKGVALASLLIVNLIRVGAVELGEKDLEGLRAFHAENQAPLAYWVDQKDIWHEFGLVSAALGTDIQRIDQRDQLETFVNQGGSLILQDTQSAEGEGLSCVSWLRLRRRMKFPLIQLLEKGLNFGDPALMRAFQICKKSHP